MLNHYRKWKKTTLNLLALSVPPGADLPPTTPPADEQVDFPPHTVETGFTGPAQQRINLIGGSLFDILGYIMSCLGPLDADVRNLSDLKSKKETFLLPLIILYGAWCGTIAKECGVAAQAPSIVEMVVRVTSPDQLYYTLGASVAGFESNTAFRGVAVQARRDMLLNGNFLTQADLQVPPQRVLTLLESENLEVQVGNPPQGRYIWNPNLFALWQKMQSAHPDKPYQPTDAEKPFAKQWALWVDQLAKADPKGPAPTIDFTGDAQELADFATKWPNPIVVQNWDSGREYGNCAETYPLMMCQSLDRL